MNKTDAYNEAKALLSEIIKNQPNLFQLSSGTWIHHPDQVANFCTTFMEKYVEERTKHDVS